VREAEGIGKERRKAVEKRNKRALALAKLSAEEVKRPRLHEGGDSEMRPGKFVA